MWGRWVGEFVGGGKECWVCLVESDICAMCFQKIRADIHGIRDHDELWSMPHLKVPSNCISLKSHTIDKIVPIQSYEPSQLSTMRYKESFLPTIVYGLHTPNPLLITQNISRRDRKTSAAFRSYRSYHNPSMFNQTPPL